MGATRLDNVQNRGNDIISPIQHIIVPETQNAILMCAQPSVAASIPLSFAEVTVSPPSTSTATRRREQ